MKKIKENALKLLPAGLVIPDLTPKNVTFDPRNFTLNLITYALYFVAVVALVFVVWGGIQYVTSGGDAEKVGKAKNTLLYAIVGIIVIVLAIGIVRWAASLPVAPA